MVTLRVFGVVMSVVALYLFYRFYRRRRSKVAFLVGLVFVVSLASVSLFPDFFNAIFHFFTTTRTVYYRINMLLIFSVIFLSILQVRTLFTTAFHERSVLDLVTRHGVREFEERYGPQDVKPIQVIIPAYNERRSLAELLPRLPDRIEGREVGVLVISDGSEDGTADAVREAGYPAVENLTNLGQGTALKVGFRVAERHGSSIVATMDADGQHDPEDLPRLVRPILEEEASLTVGTRHPEDRRQLPLLRRVGIGFFNGLVSLLLMRRITDCSNGFRAFRTDLLDRFDLEERQYHTTEFLIKALSEGARLREVPVRIHERKHGQSRKGPDVIYGWNFLKVILQTWWSRS